MTTTHWSNPNADGLEFNDNPDSYAFSAPVGLLFTRALGFPIRTITGDATLADADWQVIVDATGGNVTVTLPAATGVKKGRTYRIFRKDASGNSVTVTPPSGTINGSANFTLAQYANGTVISDGTAWWKV